MTGSDLFSFKAGKIGVKNSHRKRGWFVPVELPSKAKKALVAIP